ncbi:MAG: hypothetical protein E7Z79_08175 [Methanobrevibacter thaueri]|jgi:hypothetical protein|uniref:Uncharacterized protein n=1 Tax=Methanobrevibacter thaueri TaxID=190975 RepID=A0A8T3VC27_9EURY|nr:hypothetical protein [Methanobrevibacter thaueri]MBE6502400.1 hypothetical protein [Methanobrevibacter thaueri]
MAHPHKDAIAKMPPSALIGIIEESKMTYVRENLSIFLHESQIKLLKQVKKHEKPHHKRIRVKQFERAKKDDLFNLHLGLYLKKYQKLEKLGLIEIDLQPDSGLEYDCKLTSKGTETLDEITSLEKEWEGVVGIDDDDRETLKKLALDSFEISYRHKKKRGFIF